MNFSLIVLSHNRCEELGRNLELLLNSSLPEETELIVVDNASGDGSVALLEDLAARHSSLRLLLQSTNLGVAGGRNVGYRAARGRYLICLDDDSSLNAENDLVKIQEAFAAHPRAGILAFRIRHLQTGEAQNDHGEQPCPVANFHGAGYALRRGLLEKVGYLDDDCTFGGEELDFSIRAHAKGFTTLYLPEVVVQHNSLVRSGGPGADRRLQWLYSYLRVLFKHFPAPLAALYGGRYLVGYCWSGYCALGIGFVLRLLGYALRGLRDGIKVYHPLPPDTLTFYRQPRLTPEFGNHSILRKIFKKLGMA